MLLFWWMFIAGDYVCAIIVVFGGILICVDCFVLVLLLFVD